MAAVTPKAIFRYMDVKNSTAHSASGGADPTITVMVQAPSINKGNASNVNRVGTNQPLVNIQSTQKFNIGDIFAVGGDIPNAWIGAKVANASGVTHENWDGPYTITAKDTNKVSFLFTGNVNTPVMQLA